LAANDSMEISERFVYFQLPPMKMRLEVDQTIDN